MVNGTLIDTALETMSRPTATPRGFFSGTASATILRNDDALFVVPSGSPELGDIKRLHIDFLGCEDVGLSEGAGGEDVEESEGGDLEGVEEERCRNPRSSLELEAGCVRKARHGGLETCRANRADACGRREDATRTRALRESIVGVGVLYTAQGRRCEREKEA